MSFFRKLFGSSKNSVNTNALNPEDIKIIINDYGKVLESASPAPGCVADIMDLPHPKPIIKQALMYAIKDTTDPRMKENLKCAYIELASWQQGVGRQSEGLDLTNIDLSSDTQALAEYVLEHAAKSEKWKDIVLSEMSQLKKEIENI